MAPRINYRHGRCRCGSARRSSRPGVRESASVTRFSRRRIYDKQQWPWRHNHNCCNTEVLIPSLAHKQRAYDTCLLHGVSVHSFNALGGITHCQDLRGYVRQIQIEAISFETNLKVTQHACQSTLRISHLLSTVSFLHAKLRSCQINTHHSNLCVPCSMRRSLEVSC